MITINKQKDKNKLDIFKTLFQDLSLYPNAKKDILKNTVVLYFIKTTN